MKEEESGFVETPELNSGAGLLTLVHSSENGPAMLYRTTKFGQFVVLKCLKPEYRENELYETLLRKEFEIGYGLNHPNICRTTGFVCHPDLGNAIEMEWVDGISLDNFDGRMPEERFRKIAGELCDAVAYLHSRQIVHRDIKPSNIMLTHNGANVKLLDFGLADSDSWAVLKTPAGTRSYMAPEVLSGGVPDMRSDIWSMGKVLMGLTRGHRAVLDKCCTLRPEKRFSGADEVKIALSRKNDWPLIAAAIVLGIILAIMMPRWKESASSGVDIIEVDADTSSAIAPTEPVVTEEPAPAEPPAETRAKPHRTTTQADIDAVFESAEKLFE